MPAPDTAPGRLLLVDDDADLAAVLELLLRRAGHTVLVAGTAAEALDLLRVDGGGGAGAGVDLVLTDLNLPGGSGLDLAERVRDLVGDVPVVLMTGAPSLDAAVGAVRRGLTDFLVKPFAPGEVVEVVQRSLADARRRGHRVGGARPARRVLAIGAHPDDVEIGAGATLARHADAGDAVHVLTLSRGHHGGPGDERADEAARAAEVLGAELTLADLEDTAIPDTGDTVRLIEAVVARVRPDVVYVHSVHDTHQDHRAVHRATVVAARGVRRVCCYQSPSTTVEFRPTRFVPVDVHFPTKLKAIAAYASQTAIRDYLEPDLLAATARYWGRFGRSRLVEPFEVVRDGTDD